LVLAEYTEPNLERHYNALEKNYLPSLRGLDLREAVEVLESAGIEIIVRGHGKVMKQEPASGTALNQCSTVTLWLQ